MADREITPVEELVKTPRLFEDRAAGSIIEGHYRIEQLLGDGGMGAVYKCTDLTVGRTVAVKFLHPHLVTDDKWFRRFHQEAKAVARLEHPSIIKVLHFSPTNVPFIVMEYIEGSTLSQVLNEVGPLSIERTSKIAVQVASALAHAHAKGVVHRDLKPGNIVLLPGDDIKILDFGIAKLFEEEGAGSHKLTQTGEIFGSPSYMSPEQCRGDLIDDRSDQYSLGCVVFECLTGTAPFAGPNSFQVMTQHVFDQPPTLKEASLGRSFSERIELIVRTLLAKEPERRYSSMNAVIDSLTLIPSESKRVAAGEADRQSVKPAQITLVVVTAALLIGCTISSLTIMQQANNTAAPPHEAVAPVQPASRVDTWTDQIDEVSITANAELADLATKSFNSDTLIVRNPMISDEGLKSLRQMHNLKNLRLGGCISITEKGFDLLGNHDLRELDMQEVQNMNDAMLTKIVKKFPHLERLSLQENLKLTDKGFAQLINLKELKQVNLSDDLVSIDTIKTLAQLPHLQELQVARSGLTDKMLALVPEIKSLQILDIDGNHALTDHSIDSLTKIKGLHWLRVFKTRMSSDAVSKLRALRKSCTIQDSRL